MQFQLQTSKHTHTHTQVSGIKSMLHLKWPLITTAIRISIYLYVILYIFLSIALHRGRFATIDDDDNFICSIRFRPVSCSHCLLFHSVQVFFSCYRLLLLFCQFEIFTPFQIGTTVNRVQIFVLFYLPMSNVVGISNESASFCMVRQNVAAAAVSNVYIYYDLLVEIK